MMPRSVWAAQFVIMAAVFCAAQNPQAMTAHDDICISVSAPPEGRDQFLLGEPLSVEVSYNAASQTYVYVSNPKKLVGGRPLQIECAPPVESVFEADRARGAQVSRFQEMLVDPVCMGPGVGGGIGGGCGDCDWEQPLGNSPLRFGVGDLNRYLRFRRAGSYSLPSYVSTDHDRPYG